MFNPETIMEDLQRNQHLLGLLSRRHDEWAEAENDLVIKELHITIAEKLSSAREDYLLLIQKYKELK